MHGVECWTNHLLVRWKIKFRIKPKSRKGCSGIPKRLDVDIPKNKKVKVEFLQNSNIWIGQMSGWIQRTI